MILSNEHLDSALYFRIHLKRQKHTTIKRKLFSYVLSTLNEFQLSSLLALITRQVSVPEQPKTVLKTSWTERALKDDCKKHFDFRAIEFSIS
jgi:hypothetical protein